MLADVLVHYDALDHVFRPICLDTKQQLWIRHAARRAMVVLNKYYGKSDDSHLYRLALRKLYRSVLLKVDFTALFSPPSIDARAVS